MNYLPYILLLTTSFTVHCIGGESKRTFLKDICLETGHCFIGRRQQHSPSASAEVRLGEQAFSKLFLKLSVKDAFLGGLLSVLNVCVCERDREKERETHKELVGGQIGSKAHFNFYWTFITLNSISAALYSLVMLNLFTTLAKYSSSSCSMETRVWTSVCCSFSISLVLL